MGPIDCPETLARNCHCTLINKPEERSSKLKLTHKHKVIILYGTFNARLCMFAQICGNLEIPLFKASSLPSYVQKMTAVHKHP
jgi:hypothetical protein